MMSSFIISCHGSSGVIYCLESYMRSAVCSEAHDWATCHQQRPLPPLASTVFARPTTSRGHHSHCLTPPTSSGTLSLQSTTMPVSVTTTSTPRIYTVHCRLWLVLMRCPSNCALESAIHDRLLCFHCTESHGYELKTAYALVFEEIRWNGLSCLNPELPHHPPPFPGCTHIHWELGSGQN